MPKAPSSETLAEVNKVVAGFDRFWNTPLEVFFVNLIDKLEDKTRLLRRLEQGLPHDRINFISLKEKYQDIIINRKDLNFINEIIINDEFTHPDVAGKDYSASKDLTPTQLENLAKSGDVKSLVFYCLKKIRDENFSKYFTHNFLYSTLLIAEVLTDESTLMSIESAARYRYAADRGNAYATQMLEKYYKKTAHLIFGWHYLFALAEQNQPLENSKLITIINELAAFNYYNIFDDLAINEKWSSLQKILTLENQYIVLRRFTKLSETVNKVFFRRLPVPSEIKKEILANFPLLISLPEKIILKNINKNMHYKQTSFFEDLLKPAFEKFKVIWSTPLEHLLDLALQGDEPAFTVLKVRAYNVFFKDEEVLLKYFATFDRANLTETQQKILRIYHANAGVSPHSTSSTAYPCSNGLAKEYFAGFFTDKPPRPEKPTDKFRSQPQNHLSELVTLLSEGHWDCVDILGRTMSIGLNNNMPEQVFCAKDMAYLHHQASTLNDGGFMFEFSKRIWEIENEAEKIRFRLGGEASFTWYFISGYYYDDVYPMQISPYFLTTHEEYGEKINYYFNQFAVKNENHIFTFLWAKDNWRDIKKYLLPENIEIVYEHKRNYQLQEAKFFEIENNAKNRDNLNDHHVQEQVKLLRFINNKSNYQIHTGLIKAGFFKDKKSQSASFKNAREDNREQYRHYILESHDKQSFTNRP